jgi:hypothetical protein
MRGWGKCDLFLFPLLPTKLLRSNLRRGSRLDGGKESPFGEHLHHDKYPTVLKLATKIRTTENKTSYNFCMKRTEAVAVVALVEKYTTKTQLSTNWPVCSMKNTSFSQSRE